jgi:hypothetical protein
MRHAIINHVYIPYMEQQQMVLLCDDADADAVNRERVCVDGWKGKLEDGFMRRRG